MIREKRCIVCQNIKSKDLYISQDRILGISGKFQIKQCFSCGLLFIDPQPSMKTLIKYYASDKYFAYSESGKAGFFTTMREYIIRNYYRKNIFAKTFAFFIQNSFAMPSYIKDGKVLDMGCGVGDILLLLRRIGFKVFGLEIDKNAVSIARKKGLDVRLGTFEATEGYDDNYFDSIRLYHVIEHLSDPVECLRIARRKLKIGGELIMTTPNAHCLSRFIFGRYWSSLDSPRHLFIFNPRLLSFLARKEGFQVASIEYNTSLGLLGSLHIAIFELLKRRIRFLDMFISNVLLYPLEMLLILFHTSDAFTIRVVKTSGIIEREK